MHNHNCAFDQNHLQLEENCVLPIRELPHSFASGSLTAAAITETSRNVLKEILLIKGSIHLDKIVPFLIQWLRLK